MSKTRKCELKHEGGNLVSGFSVPSKTGKTQKCITVSVTEIKLNTGRTGRRFYSIRGTYTQDGKKLNAYRMISKEDAEKLAEKMGMKIGSTKLQTTRKTNCEKVAKRAFKRCKERRSPKKAPKKKLVSRKRTKKEISRKKAAKKKATKPSEKFYSTKPVVEVETSEGSTTESEVPTSEEEFDIASED